MFAAVPSLLMLVALGALAVGALVVAAVLLQGVLRAPAPSVALPVLAVAPFIFPFAIAVLFGNLDSLFALLYGLMLVGALGAAVSSRMAGGAALAIAAITKVHPASMGLWFIV